jgi:MYXO-CTERM domain-containing protein
MTMQITHRIFLSSCAALLLGWSSPAQAAPPPSVGGGSGPEQEACAGRSVGDACTMPNRQLGTCGEGTCNRLDYSKGSPPQAIEEPCVVCQPAQGQPQGHGDMPALGTAGTPPEDESGANDKEPPKSSSRCSVQDDLDPLASLGLAGLLLLALVRRRT